MPDFAKVDNELPNDDEVYSSDEVGDIVSAIRETHELQTEMLEAIVYRQALAMELNPLMEQKVAAIIVEIDGD